MFLVVSTVELLLDLLLDSKLIELLLLVLLLELGGRLECYLSFLKLRLKLGSQLLDY
jgi:hypothetical protein